MNDPEKTSTGTVPPQVYLLYAAPFLALVTTLVDWPLWIEIPIIVLVLIFVGLGAAALRTQLKGSWKPSETLRDGSDDRR